MEVFDPILEFKRFQPLPNLGDPALGNARLVAQMRGMDPGAAPNRVAVDQVGEGGTAGRLQTAAAQG